MAVAKYSRQVGAYPSGGIIETVGLDRYVQTFEVTTPASSVTVTKNGGVLPTDIKYIEVYDNGAKIHASGDGYIRDWEVSGSNINFVEDQGGIAAPVILSGRINVVFWI